MDPKRLRVRICRSTGELEIEGDSGLVRDWWDELFPQIASVAREKRKASTPPEDKGAERENEGEDGEPFGEFFHNFRDDISDGDRMLIAASFVQTRTDDRTFTTGAANQLLIEQGRKLANPSVCVKRLVDAKRAFRVSGQNHRVSDTGLKHVESLRMQEHE